ncbi:hypothetical protein BFW38_05355 [Terasakiispira papahanaumokuakeensis]|uniref:Uncharacterized protein n=1 Tax=Terasakiispira papahanaumokuakeensis TaxID=197479 RepID=A0A1E2V7S0_9GAMM|nr:hypothetical protein [Terasakiispira papahanaumokuakeensis]ODC03059.1 hypothetical protein BFW38_05355 [Terasakiispira papahanaumokuakeensis]
MPWNDKCQWGQPTPFNNHMAAIAVNNANFLQSVFVNTSENGNTRQAYTYHEVGGYRICVVGHIHINDEQVVAGASFIPGWDNWSMQTPQAAVDTIADLPDQGSFPGNDRYPHPT